MSRSVTLPLAVRYRAHHLMANPTVFVRRHLVAIGAVVIAVIVAILAGPRVLLGPKVPVDTVVRQNFVQTIVASGRVEAPHRVDISAQITGTVRRVPVREGQTVVAGATLVELESAELEASLAQAQRAVQAATASIRQMEEVQAPGAAQTLKQAQISHDAARDAYVRSRALLEAGAISPVEFDAARRAEEAAAAQLRIAEQHVARARPSGSDAAAAAAALAQARAGADLARARLAYATIRAPSAGTLIARDVEPGDVVQPGRALMVLSPGGETQLVVQIDEKNLHLLSLGLSALASADAYPNQRFDAQIAYINPGIDAQRGAVEVKLRVPSPPPYLKQDMTVSVDIAIARRANAVLVASDAVHDLDRTAPWVLVIDGRQARKRQVTLGLVSNGLCEVLHGLAAGDRVVPVATETVTDGARIRPVAVGSRP